eukprot:COSAG06_NODE_56525_length_284_cov_0.837838_1_plen_67_part_10
MRVVASVPTCGVAIRQGREDEATGPGLRRRSPPCVSGSCVWLAHSPQRNQPTDHEHPSEGRPRNTNT